MKKITIGIIAHVDSGKTTLSEAMLYKSGTIRNFGRVDKGESFLDTDTIERRRGITIYSKQAAYEYGDTSFIMLDTPGHSDFSAEMERTLQVLDYAILLISASDGIRGQSETLWKLLKEYEIPTFIFFNKMDQEGANKDRLLLSGRALLDDGIVEFGKNWDEEFYDQVAMNSENAMEQFLEEGHISKDVICQMIEERELFPCFFGSALNMDGVDELMTALDELTLKQEYPEKFGARAYKIMHDGGVRLTCMKITGGTLKTKDMITDGDEDVKVNQIRVYAGDRYTLVTEVSAGDICAIEGLKNSHAGDGYGIEAGIIPPMLIPVLSYRVLFPDGEDPSRQLINFRVMEEESPELLVRWNEDKREINLCVMGEVQLEIIHETYLNRYGVNIAFDTGEVMYCETITKSTIGVGHFEPLRHYAEVHLLMEPMPEGSGISFETDVSTDDLARNWQRLVLTHLYEKEHRGVLTGAPITDMKITLIAGRAHLKHTEGGDFRQATYRAVRQGLMMTESKLLEPYYRFTIDLPTDNLGRAMTDLDKMNAQISAPQTDAQRGNSVLMGRVPVSAFRDYPREIAAYTKGLGNVSIAPDGYSTCHNPEEVIDRIGYDPTADLKNSPDSVFCAHGAGTVVPYSEVYEHMHIPFDKNEVTDEGVVYIPKRSRTAETDIWLGIDEVDSIIAGISRSGAGYKSTKPGWKRSRRRRAEAETKKYVSSSSKTRVFDKATTEYLLVDGYNVIFAWEDLNELALVNIDSARGSLLDTMCNYQGIAGCEVIVVFDAYRVKGHNTEYGDYHNIHVVYTKEAETADAYIERFAHEHASSHRVTVVTSDGLEQIIIRGEGCGLISSREFKKYIDDISEKMRKEYNL